MKVSESTKEKTKRKILEAAITLMTEEGFQKVTMKRIAKAAGVGDATIYKYFSSKERILLGYYEMVSEDTIKEVREIEDDFSLQEHVQVILDTFIEKLMAEREFAQKSFRKLFFNPFFAQEHFSPIKAQFANLFEEVLNQAIEREEIQELPFQGALPNFMVEYMIGILHYWLQDESEEFHETTQLIDLTLTLWMTLLTSGIVHKATDLVGFFIKTQMFKIMTPGNPMLSQIMNGIGGGMQGMSSWWNPQKWGSRKMKGNKEQNGFWGSMGFKRDNDCW